MIIAPDANGNTSLYCATHCPLYLYKPSPPSPSGPTRNTAHLKKERYNPTEHSREAILPSPYPIRSVPSHSYLPQPKRQPACWTMRYGSSCTSALHSHPSTHPAYWHHPIWTYSSRCHTSSPYWSNEQFPVSPSERSDKPYRSAGSTDPISRTDPGLR